MFGTNEWSKLFADIHKVCPEVPRRSIGATSFRKYYAQALSEAGVSDDAIKAIGYWFTDIFKVYAGASRMPRLRAQKAATAKTFDLMQLLKDLQQAAAKPQSTATTAAVAKINSVIDEGESGVFFPQDWKVWKDSR